VELRDQLSHVVVFFTAWSFISQTVTEGSSAFIDAERYLRQERLPKFAFVLRVVWRNLIAYLHNIVLLPIVFLVFAIPVGWTALESLLGLAFVLVNVTLTVVIVSVFCTRFRDLRLVVQNFVQMAFFASPVMWRPDILPPEARLLVDLNPVAAHLRLIGDPLLGQPAPTSALYMCLGTTVVLLAVAAPIFTRFRERIVYWL
jgi:lipopolysaccharide transport system permease protein